MILSISAPQKQLAAYALISALALAGCGGGGGSDGVGGNAQAPTPTPAPTPAPTPPTTESQTQATTTGHALYHDITAAYALAHDQASGYGSFYSDFASGSSSISCPGGGTASHVVADNGTAHVPDAGDSITYTFNDCVLSGGASTNNGSFVLTWISGSGDPGSTNTWTAKYSVAYQQSTASSAYSEASIDGTLVVDISSTSSVQKSVTLTSGGLQKKDYTGSTTGTYTLQDTIDDTGQTTTYTVDAAGIASLTLQGGHTVTYSNSGGAYDLTYTPATPFTFNISGVLMSGSLSAAIHSSGNITSSFFSAPDNTVPTTINFKWTVIDNTSTTLESDLNNDGVYETKYALRIYDLE